MSLALSACYEAPSEPTKCLLYEQAAYIEVWTCDGSSYRAAADDHNHQEYASWGAEWSCEGTATATRPDGCTVHLQLRSE